METLSIRLDSNILPQVNDLEDDKVQELLEAAEEVKNTRVEEGTWPY